MGRDVWKEENIDFINNIVLNVDRFYFALFLPLLCVSGYLFSSQSNHYGTMDKNIVKINPFSKSYELVFWLEG